MWHENPRLVYFLLLLMCLVGCTNSKSEFVWMGVEVGRTNKTTILEQFGEPSTP